ncbi:hypothetical protein I5G80_gp048 [Mycobacterium phage Krueger]|uniref:Uncharacterized protein n=1 Tax=Mycobacterium phage Krueger TaxID=2015820 RepID=A0A222ZNJ6_9CAUD|nr:hypothetical protein I5G80_gp048 [Mycobacterium phage Krueger]ASR85600.1 hypothetical protein SEA_KRUEGER_98 [Mycobacterium phage Krueger]
MRPAHTAAALLAALAGHHASPAQRRAYGRAIDGGAFPSTREEITKWPYPKPSARFSPRSLPRWPPLSPKLSPTRWPRRCPA